MTEHEAAIRRQCRKRPGRLAGMVVPLRRVILVAAVGLMVVSWVIVSVVAGRLTHGEFDDPASESSRAAAA